MGSLKLLKAWRKSFAVTCIKLPFEEESTQNNVGHDKVCVWKKRNQNDFGLVLQNNTAFSQLEGIFFIKYLLQIFINIYSVYSWSYGTYVKVAQKPFLTLNHIFAKPKDPVPKEQKSDAKYSIPCNDCNQEYIGQTKRQFWDTLKRAPKSSLPFKKG